MSRQVVGLLLNYLDAGRSIRCIQSLLDEGVSKVVVWDNSADGGMSVDAIRVAFGDDEHLDIRTSAVNLGFSAGVNRALEHCAKFFPGAWVLLINNDARLLPGGLSKLVDALAVNPVAKLAFPNINHGGLILGRAYCHRLTGLLSWRPRRGFFPYASGCCMLVATDRIELPLFDEDFFMYGEDWELGWRFTLQSAVVEHIDETLVEHEGAASSGLGSPFYEASMVAAHLILAHKLAKTPLDACVLYVLRAIMLVARALMRSIRFHSFTPCKALWHGARIAFGKR
ncbi:MULTISPECIES: glycosyltransferase [unclassified Rhodanobacter]|uniref:glycosyltransferase n=1 Tax=unclassified Rhodanobacter TaxID=2621553 RepID=UPI001BDE88D0|nr:MULTISPECIES: glycosyltransferase [unclassified Rhodanobacter]MBT2143291.1 glycosyltransferase [Rhodanobacter sp. LX-99]MBT2147635.1 glycosyltransferase [Rhodanobacter sp. LX-100]